MGYYDSGQYGEQTPGYGQQVAMQQAQMAGQQAQMLAQQQQMYNQQAQMYNQQAQMYNQQQMMQNQGYGMQASQPQGYGMQQQGYGMQQPYGYDQYGFPKIRKVSWGEMHERLVQYIYMNTNVYVNQEAKVDDAPDTLRHCCARAKVSLLTRNNFQVEDGSSLPFYFCMACGKLIYCKEYMA